MKFWGGPQLSLPDIKVKESGPSPNLSSRPERTRISCLAKLTRAARAAFRKESRRNLVEATNFNRKSGAA